jgi:hypothetical protein
MMTAPDYDLDTKQGMNNAVTWTRNMFSLIRDGGTWMVPRSMTIVRINHTDKIATLIVGFAPDPSLKRVIEAMGWTVVEK